jgi:formylglycine-generating enzyme required for sulfatase activity
VSAQGAGAAKVDGLYAAVLNNAYARPTLLAQARCAGLLGAMLADLQALEYHPNDPRFEEVLEAARAVFCPADTTALDFQVRLDAADALGQLGDFRLRSENWVTFSAGDFWMGAQKRDRSHTNYDPDANEDEEPVQCVHVNAYELGIYPVTVEEYRKFLEGEGYRDRRWWTAGECGEKNEPTDWDVQLLHPNRPVVGVNWYEAAAYCCWAGGRLPTEAEWQRAARGLSGRRHAWGGAPPDSSHGNFGGTVGHATPVGLYPAGATPEGIHDMSGNVWEWTNDRYRPYGVRSQSNPISLALAYQRVACGGAWNNSDMELRAACRGREHPLTTRRALGFRCARDARS